MTRAYTTVVTLAAACCVSAAIACSVATPLTPEPPPGSSAMTAADGATLKAGPPTLVSPINSDFITTQKPTLTISRAIGEFSSTAQFAYEFELQSDTGTVLVRGSSNGNTFTVPDNLPLNAAFRWRARAALNGAVGPYSGLARFQTPRLNTPTASSSNDDWKNWFFQLVDLRGVGPTMTVQALITLDPDFAAAGVIQETNSAGQPRGRIYLPNNSSDKYARSVDLGNFGGPWQWLPRGATTCEGGSCR